jgi:hypothetical protein
VCGLLIPVDDKEKARVEALFALADGVKAPVAKPLMN